jgi:hypothetical protein
MLWADLRLSKNSWEESCVAFDVDVLPQIRQSLNLDAGLGNSAQLANDLWGKCSTALHVPSRSS